MTPLTDTTVPPSEAGMDTGVADGLPPFLTLAEVARLLRRTERTLRNWRRAGLLHTQKIGRAVLVKRADFLRLIGPGL